jgi:hypothetical protein
VIFSDDDVAIKAQFSKGLGRVQGWFNPQDNKITLVADNLTPEIAKGVLLHEIWHRAETMLLTTESKKALVGFVSKWKDAGKDAPERKVYEAAHRRANNSGDYDGEFIAYAIEEAVNNGAVINNKLDNTVGGFLTRVRNLFNRAVNRLFPNYKTQLNATDLLRMAKAAFIIDQRNNGYADSEQDGDGKQYSNTELLAPNGKPSKLTPKQYAQVRTPEFKAWFGDWENDPANASKVVDENGEPMVVYHGTKKGGFTEFDTNRRVKVDNAYFFTSNKQMARSYSGITNEIDLNTQEFDDDGDPTGYYDEQRGIYSVFLNIREPNHTDMMGANWDGQLDEPNYNLLDDDGDIIDTVYTHEEAQNAVDEGRATDYETVDEIHESTDSAVREGQHFGLDGAFIYDVQDNGSAFDAYEKGDVYVAFNPNQIKSATNNTGSFSPANDDIRYSRADDGVKTTPKEFSGIGWNVKVTGKAYEGTVKAIGKHLSKVGIRGMSDAARKEQIRYTDEVSKRTRNLVDLAKTVDNLSAEQGAMVSDIIEKEYQGGTPPKDLVDIAASIVEYYKAQADVLVKLGMLSEASRDFYGEKYLPRIYMKGKIEGLKESLKSAIQDPNKTIAAGIDGSHLKGRGKSMFVNKAQVKGYLDSGWIIRDKETGAELDASNIGEQSANDVAHKGKVLMWKDYTRKEREAMNENRDVRSRLLVSGNKIARSIALGHLFKRVADNSELSSDKPKLDFVLVPADKIAESGGVLKYGALAGKYVDKHVFEMMKQERETSRTLRVYDAIHSFWKRSHTAWNTTSHTNNTVSNMIMAAMLGTLHELPKAITSMATKDKYYKMADDANLFDDRAHNRELQTLLAKFSGEVIPSDEAGRSIAVVRKLGELNAAYGTGALENQYQLEEQVFKMATFRQAIDEGATPEQAREYAERFFFNYNDIPRSIRVAKRFFFPFITYSYKAVPALAYLVANKPHRVLPFVAGSHFVNHLTSIMAFGGDAGEVEDWLEAHKRIEEAEKGLAPWLRGLSLLGLPVAFNLPTRDENGNQVTVDLSNMTPAGLVMRMGNPAGGAELPTLLTGFTPYINSAIATIINKDMFTGKDIVSNTDKVLGKEWEKRLKYLAATWSPALPIIPYSYQFNRYANAIVSQQDTIEEGEIADLLRDEMGYSGMNKQGKGASLFDANLRQFGIKRNSVDEEQQKGFENRSVITEIRELKRAIGRIKGDKSMSDNAKMKAIDENMNAISALMKHTGEGGFMEDFDIDKYNED